MELQYHTLPDGWPVVESYDTTDFRWLVASFLESDLGTHQPAIEQYLLGLALVQSGEIGEWAVNGNSYRLVVTPDGCHLRQYDPHPQPGQVAECYLPNEELAAVLRAWKAHVQAANRLE